MELMEKMLRNKFNKKGTTEVMMPIVIFLILNLLFFSMLILFVTKQASGAVVYEQMYAKKIALLVDDARCSGNILLEVSDILVLVEKNNYDVNKVFLFNDKTNKIIVKTSENSGYSYVYFSDCVVNSRIDNEVLAMEFGVGVVGESAESGVGVVGGEGELVGGGENE